ncbi:MAG: DUF3473 domain-containing protein [Acidimicrobiales bacterium]
MSATVCLTVDVEDWYDGMAVLGHPVPRPADARSGLGGLLELLDRAGGTSKVTLFCVGNYVDTVRTDLLALVEAGHEVAGHGPDHGRLPEDPAKLGAWLRQGREMLEDRLGVAVRGFRSPRFDVPASIGLRAYRELLAQAGYEYVSDTSLLGAGAAVRELPVLVANRVPVGGGSYQRVLPTRVLHAAVRRAASPAVCYYHSYDFGATLPPLHSIRSVTEAEQLVGRGRIKSRFSELLTTYGSKACHHVASSV